MRVALGPGLHPVSEANMPIGGTSFGWPLARVRFPLRCVCVCVWLALGTNSVCLHAQCEANGMTDMKCITYSEGFKKGFSSIFVY